MAYIINQLYSDFQRGHYTLNATACTSQPVAFNGHLSTQGCLTGLRNKPQQKLTHQHLAVVYWQLVSLLMELSIDDETVLCHGVHKWQVMAKQVT